VSILKKPYLALIWFLVYDHSPDPDQNQNCKSLSIFIAPLILYYLRSYY
jgi:hypothetical protein